MNKVVVLKYCGFFSGVGSGFILAAFLDPEDTSKYAAMLSLINILVPILSFGSPTMIIWSAREKDIAKQVGKLNLLVTAVSALIFFSALVGLISGHYAALFLILLSLTIIARCSAAYVRVNRSSVAAALFESLGLKILPALLFLLVALQMGLTLWTVVALQAACTWVFILATYDWRRRISPAIRLALTTVKTALKKASLQFIAVAAKEIDSIIALALMDATMAVSVFLGKRAYAVGSVINESSRLIYQPDFSSVGTKAAMAPDAYWTARRKNIALGTIANAAILLMFLIVCNLMTQTDVLSNYFDVTSDPFGTQTQIVVTIYLLARCVENLFGPIEQYLVMQDLHVRAALVNVSIVLLKAGVFAISLSGLYGVAAIAFARSAVVAAVWQAGWIPQRNSS